METLWQLILTKKNSFLLIRLLQIFILLIDQILNLSLELCLHRPNLRRNNVSQGLIHDRDSFKLYLAFFILKFDEILLIGYFDFVLGRYLLKKYCFGFIDSHFF